jgi:hypothetical protein
MPVSWTIPLFWPKQKFWKALNTVHNIKFRLLASTLSFRRIYNFHCGIAATDRGQLCVNQRQADNNYQDAGDQRSNNVACQILYFVQLDLGAGDDNHRAEQRSNHGRHRGIAVLKCYATHNLRLKGSTVREEGEHCPGPK